MSVRVCVGSAEHPVKGVRFDENEGKMGAWVVYLGIKSSKPKRRTVKVTKILNKRDAYTNAEKHLYAPTIGFKQINENWHRKLAKNAWERVNISKNA